MPLELVKSPALEEQRKRRRKPPRPAKFEAEPSARELQLCAEALVELRRAIKTTPGLSERGARVELELRGNKLRAKVLVEPPTY